MLRWTLLFPHGFLIMWIVRDVITVSPLPVAGNACLRDKAEAVVVCGPPDEFAPAPGSGIKANCNSGLLGQGMTQRRSVLQAMTMAPLMMAPSFAIAARKEAPKFIISEIFEFSYGEVPWRSELVDPPQRVEKSSLIIADRPGLGYAISEKVAAKYAV